MNDTEAFLRKIRENPDDDAPRLVFADYLDEQAQNSSGKDAKEQAKWAALIRAQVAEVRESLGDVSLWNKWAGLDNSNDFSLAKRLIPKGCGKIFEAWSERGFYDSLEGTIGQVVDISEFLVESVAPIQSLNLTFLDSEWDEIAENPLLGLIRNLNLSENESISPASLKGICRDSQLRALTSLNISDLDYSEIKILSVLKNCHNFVDLKRFYVAFYELSEFRELLKYPITNKLEALVGGETNFHRAELCSQAPLAKSLTFLEIDDHGATTSKKPKWGEFHNLRHLELSAVNPKDWVTPFLESQDWTQLSNLELTAKGIPNNVLSHFEKGGEELTLKLSQMTRPQLKRILSSPTMKRVKVLEVQSNFPEYAIEVLSKNDAIINLRSLKLNTLEGIKQPIPLFKTLSTSPIFANLLHFETNASISYTALKQLAGSAMGQSLRALICEYPHIASKWQEFLRDPKNFPNLVHFSLRALDFDDNFLAKGRKKLILN